MNRTLRYGILLTAIIAGINLFFSSIAYIINNSLTGNTSAKIFFIVLASILSSTIVAYFIVSTTPIFKEYLTTFRRLLRLESLSHPLLVKFSHTAPGTYHHTLTVANIASRAAKTIGADSLLTRVGAYYHDIGKLSDPEFFVENQTIDQNTHDEIDDPNQSAQIIIDHIQKGVEIAKENYLPQEVINFIQQHHGTTTVSYFYEKSKSENDKSKKSDFRYPGPKPQSTEIAIVMLADILEATIRAESNPTPQDIKNLVNKTIEEKTNEGQLDAAGINAKQMTKIRRSFIESLTAIFHQRIQYPKDSTKSNPKK